MAEESQKNTNYHSDEITLKELFDSIGGFFSKIGLSIIRLLVGIKKATLKNKNLLATFIIFGSIAGASVKFLFEPYYESSMLLKSTHLNKELIRNSINNLNQLCFENNYEELSRVLKIPTDKTAQIKFFSATPFILEEQVVEMETLKERLKNDIKDEEKLEFLMEQLEIKNQNVFEITVQTYNQLLLEGLTESVSNYFKSQPFVAKRLEIEKKNRLEKKQEIIGERGKLDSLKKILYLSIESLSEKERDGSNNVILSQSLTVNPLSVFQQDLELLEEEQELNEEIFLEPNFEIIDEFTNYSKPASPGLIENLLFGVLYGLLAAYGIIFIISFNNYLRKFE